MNSAELQDTGSKHKMSGASIYQQWIIQIGNFERSSYQAASKIIKYLVINLTKEVKSITKDYNAMLKETKDIVKWKGIPYS